METVSDPVSEAPEPKASVADTNAAFAAAAYTILKEVAGGYSKTITFPALSEALQARTGLEAPGPLREWMASMLAIVAQECVKNNEPLLPSLCVTADRGEMGFGYGALVLDIYDEKPDNLDAHADAERLKCYRAFGAKLPADGGNPTPTTQVARRLKLEREKAAAARPRRTCPTCHVQMPITGECGNCD